MSELQIDNPTETISYNLTWTDLKTHILKVVATFPKEYSIVKNETDKIILLNIPVSQANKTIAKDQIIYIDNETPGGFKATIKLVMTNEDNKISSYTELDRDKKSLNVFVILLKKSIDGTLGKSVANVNTAQKPKVNTAQGIIQILILIVSIGAILYALSVLMH